MSLFFTREVERVKQELLVIGALAEKNLQLAVRAVLTHDVAQAPLVKRSEKDLDQREVQLEEEVLKVLALYQPVAHDLRLLIAVLKINQELERIGDLAVDIAKLSERLAGQPLVPIACPLEEMSARAQRMVQESLDALVNLDADLARKVWNDDDEVDRMNAQCLQSFTEHIQREPEHTAMLSNYAWVSGHLERVADHAANISKSVLYLIKGEIVRHRGRIFKKPDPPPAATLAP